MIGTWAEELNRQVYFWGGCGGATSNYINVKEPKLIFSCADSYICFIPEIEIWYFWLLFGICKLKQLKEHLKIDWMRKRIVATITLWWHPTAATCVFLYKIISFNIIHQSKMSSWMMRAVGAVSLNTLWQKYMNFSGRWDWRFLMEPIIH